MADAEKTNRSPDAKEQSRQQSRSVTGKEAAKGVSGQPGAGQRTSPKGGGPKGPGSGKSPQGRAPGAKGAGNRPGQGGKGGGRRPARSGGRAGAPGPRRSSTALLTWGVVGLVLVVVIVLVVVKLTSSSSPGTTAVSQPVPAAITQQVTNIPTSVYDTVGINSPTVAVTPPKVLKGQPLLTFDGKPGVFFMGGEFCPYCAAERWSVIASLSRFGKFTGLRTMASSSTDVDPSTATFTFAQATFTSPYLTARLREYYSNVLNSAGNGYTILNKLDKTETKLVSKYDVGKYTGASSTSGQSIPFMDFGNKALAAGASYDPSILAGLSRSQIADDLSDPGNPVTQAIITSSNYMSAATCATTGDKPASVCTSKGVAAAAKALGFKS